MAYVIINTCEGDGICEPACEDQAISHGSFEYEGVTYDQYFIDPSKCIDCGTCESLCPTGSIFVDLELPSKVKQFKKINAAFFAQA